MALALDQFRSALRGYLADQQLSAAEADALGRLSDEQKTIFRQEVRLDHFPDPATAESVLARLGVAPAELDAPKPDALDRLGGKLKGQVVKLAEKEIFKARDFTVAELKGERAGVALRINAQLIDLQDPLIASDANRAATTQAMKAAGDKLTWARIGGGIFPQGGFSFSLPALAANVSAGFNASASLGYSVLAPYALEPESALSAARNMTVDLPFSAKKAKALIEGTEVVIRGSGQIAAHAGIGIGKSLGNDLIMVGASAYGGVAASKSGELAIRVKKLDGAKVYVSISKVEANANNVNAGIHVGVDAKLKQSLPDLGGSLYQKAGELLADQVDKQIEKWLTVDFRAVHSSGSSEREVGNYVIDLSSADGKKAYDGLLQLDARFADQMVAEHQPEIRSARLSEKTRTVSNTLDGNFGPVTLLSYVSNAVRVDGELETSQGKINYHRAELVDGYNGIISRNWNGKLGVERKLLSTTFEGQAPEYHYHLRGTVTGDGVTSATNVRQFLQLADDLGALGLEQKALLGNEKFLKSFDDTDRIVDVFVTHAGLEKLVAADDSAIIKTHADAAERLDRPGDVWTPFGWGQDRIWKTPPWLETAHPKYAQVMQLLERGPEPGANNGRGGGQTRDQKYSAITGRSLSHDSSVYKEGKMLLSIIQAMRATNDPGARIKILADKESELGLEFARSLATIGQLVGPEGVLVNELAMKDLNGDKTLTFASEGAIQDPRGEIEARLANVA